uniref:Uncharacterized protein n=1 Tax=Lepeophtheirus salmonis TaxID=72036 RepID=A0A0K2UKV8_LEPSM
MTSLIKSVVVVKYSFWYNLVFLLSLIVKILFTINEAFNDFLKILFEYLFIVYMKH